MLLAEELALVAIDPVSGHVAWGSRDELNACLAGLLVAELALAEDGTARADPLLAAAQDVLAEKRSNVKAALSHMSRGLHARVGAGTWDAVVDRLAGAGTVARDDGGLRARYRVVDPAPRDAIVDRLRAAAGSDEALEPRTAVLLSMTGPARLLEVVAPERRSRRHARRRIDHALDAEALQSVAESVREILAEAAMAATFAATAGAAAAARSG